MLLFSKFWRDIYKNKTYKKCEIIYYNWQIFTSFAINFSLISVISFFDVLHVQSGRPKKDICVSSSTSILLLFLAATTAVVMVGVVPTSLKLKWDMAVFALKWFSWSYSSNGETMYFCHIHRPLRWFVYIFHLCHCWCLATT